MPRDLTTQTSTPALDAVAVTPHDTTLLTNPTDIRGIFVGVAGDVSLQCASGAVVFKGCYAGQVLPVKCSRVNSTSTTATDMVALY